MTTVYSADWVLPVAGPPIRDGGVAVRDGLIATVGPAADLHGDERRHFPESAIVPGFVNAHSHLEYAVYGGFGDGLPFGEWILLHMERKARLDFDGMVDVARVGVAECLAAGITAAGDASFSGAAAVAADDLGLRAIVFLEVFGSTAEDLGRRIEPNRERIGPVLSPRVQLGVSPHSPYTVAPELYRACLELGLPVSTHLAESRAEHDWLLEGAGPWQRFAAELPPPLRETGVRALARHRALDSRMSAAHCVTVDAEEIALLAEHGVAVVHCPRSNAMLGCGIAPVAELREAGLRVGLGTDSPASAPSFDMFEEMRTAIALARARAADVRAMTPADALRLATLGGAEALGLDGEIGSLVPGKAADLAVLSLSGSPFLPVEDPAAAVVLGGTAARVSRTIVGGETRYEEGGIGWQELRQRAAAARARMLASASSR